MRVPAIATIFILLSFWKSMIKENPWCSLNSGQLSKGCKLCVKGKKLVLFITGLCPQRCFYCPVSEHKFGHDVAYANEWKIKDPLNPVELIEEAKLTNASGAGITGGDPLADTERCVLYIKLLKDNFGKKFHIHLYTPMALVNKERLQKLYDAGLDEIRFHPDLDDDSLWHRLSLAKEFDWTVGAEIPCVPGYEEKTKKLIDFMKDKVEFLNLNELELSDTSAKHYKLESMFTTKDNISYAVKGSKELALILMDYAKPLPVHFCTAQLKDSVQVKQRLINRAKQVSLPFDSISDDGTLVRGCIYFPSCKPGAKYKERMASITLEQLQKAKSLLLTEGFVDDEIVIDKSKMRLILPPETIEDNAELILELSLQPDHTMV